MLRHQSSTEALSPIFDPIFPSYLKLDPTYPIYIVWVLVNP